MRTKMQRWAIGGAFAAIVSCGGESVIGGGEDAGGTGGTAGMSGSSGTTGGTGATTGGTGGTGGTTGAAGNGGGAMSPGGTLPFESAECDFPAVLSSTCATSGCHKQTAAIPVAAGLSLLPDSGFVSRVKDVPATHSDIYCGSVPCPTIPAECPTSAKLVDSANWQESWIYRKITDPMGCGETMPPSVTFPAANRACIELLVKTIAELP
jgi:hypothetical protein